MRLNETMEAIGDNSLIKETFDQVTSQTASIRQMELSSQNMEASILHISESMGEIRDNTYHMMTSFQDITQNMNESICVVNESSKRLQSINEKMQSFREKISKIGKIVDIVKKIASQSNLLALNAAIEAGRAGMEGAGFAIVAQEMQKLATSTTDSAEDITNYINQLLQETELLASSTNETAKNLHDGNSKVELSLQDMEQMNQQINSIHHNVDSIFADIDTQTNSAKDFSAQTDSLSRSYELLSKDCIHLGKHVFQIGRYIDKTRSDMVRHNSIITELDWIRVFEVDHFVLMWRVYNNIVGFERLLSKQVNNPTKCKLGLWIANQADSRITNCDAFRQLKSAHLTLHEFATRSWQAKEDGDEELAMEYFKKAYHAFEEFDYAIKHLQDTMRSIGYQEATEIETFSK